MNSRWISHILWTVGGVAFVASVLSAYFGLTLPIQEFAVRPASVPAVKPASHHSSSDIELSLSSLQAAAAIQLRRPLIDPPPAPVIATETPTLPPPTVSATVVGTILEGARSFALLSGATGGTDIKGVGDFVGEARIVQITADAVTFEVKGQTAVVPVAKQEKLADKEADLK